MTETLPSWPAVGREDLGGGFVLFRGKHGESAIAATALAQAGCIGLMSCSPINARNEDVARQWIAGCGVAEDVRSCFLNQVHGSRVVHADDVRRSQEVTADGAWSASPKQGVGVTAADCAPVWIADARQRLMALVHAGWRGVLAGIIQSGVAALAAEGARTSGLLIAIGPHLRSCCFEVGPEVAQRFESVRGALHGVDGLRVPRLRADSKRLDLSAAIEQASADAGVPGNAVRVCEACTRCRSDIFHSYRRNGPGGPLMVALGMVST